MESLAIPLLWSLLLAVVKAPRPFDGTYTVVNKANGRRMFASTQAGLFVVDDSGPIYHDQMWLFAPQDNDSFAIVNAANGMRVLAQAASEGENGFFAIDNGPVYQDQRWWLSPESDGSYVMKNVKSGRRILARIGDHGKPRFAAIADSEPVQPDETWWIINQERDDTAIFIAELRIEKERVAKLSEQTAAAKNASGQLAHQLERALTSQRKATMQTQTWRHKTSTTMAELQKELSAKAKLASDVAAHREVLGRLQSELVVQKQGREQLFAQVGTYQGELVQRNFDLEGARSAQRKLTEELQAKVSETARLATEVRAVSDAKGELVSAVSIMQSHVASLSQQLNATSEANFELASKVEIFEKLPGYWMSNMDMSRKLLATFLAIALVAAITSCGRRHVGLLVDVRGKQKRIAMLEQELHAEFGDTVRVGDFDGCLGSDFGFHVFNTEINQEAVRLIKVQCPGVKHADVEIELIFNGCEVTINRQASRGVASTNWKKSFQFKPSDGLFEFREEQMVLEDGFLQLVFRACAFQNRMVLFPRHFSLAETDTDACWDYSQDDEGEHGDDADAWWRESPGKGCGAFISPAAAGKPGGSLADVDTESTASTARVLV